MNVLRMNMYYLSMELHLFCIFTAYEITVEVVHMREHYMGGNWMGLLSILYSM